ncbi:discoidin domain-containing protein [Streptomyces sp. P01-B04]|uniref:Discoidin domain-containing protein n=2 Tax=Streptomyces poriferorum TaxID=2798799 RepID=A0ABY9J284_9ACTN|nr:MULTISPECIES: discoidin domain-containing protein [Streptomyces]MBW5248128.1 discoidin domain-containing protein [Streptomyces poriferorum]MDP5310055.1 discoidin domain-containing protein [Streptomyces sp. Alt4]WLQ60776.1 discoidin domain-containing protein [Streptomyces sp. Alt2]WSI61337.1 discoidin domain-containing protein [Streptomyces sp. NBC_01336]
MYAPPLFHRPAPSTGRRRAGVLTAVAGLVVSLLAFVPSSPASAAPSLLSQGRTVTTSSQENGGTPATAAVDGDNGTRWSSAFADPQWIKVDLGSTASVSQIALKWEAAYAKGYRIEFSTDDSTWSTAYSTTTSPGGTETLNVSGNARYVRLTGTTRATQYGYSLWEFQVFGTTGGTGGPQIPGGGDLGPNVLVFDPSTPNIQAKVDEIFKQQESAQFGTGRYALMFKPGTYNNINAQIGFYTQIAGLGLKPDDTTFNGDVTVDAGWFNGNATQNFWRSAENLALNPVSGTDRWAVSQAAPFRRMHVKGGLNLAPNGYGWASGGYIADSKIDGQVGPYSQQQWYTRDSTIGSWGNGVWNMTFSGVEGAPAQSFPNPPYTTLENTPVSREKPFLYLDGNNYKVFVPAKRTNARGVSWNGTPQGESIPLSQFYVVKPGASAATINAAVQQGLHLLFTPGVYHVDQTINIDRANTVVLGLGLATIIPDNGVTAIKVGDVDGVKLAGLLVDAGPQNSQVLVQVGPDGASADHAANPTTVQDVFVRVGGAGAGKATTGMVINNDDTIIDHTWLWRADHGDGVGWETNRADYGLQVNGDDVLATGLFVEHFNKYDVRWSGERGKTIFFQNEKAYDAPNQAAIQNGGTKGYAAYKVDDSVTTHEGWGLGSYCYFNVDPTIRQDHGFQAPVKPGVKFHDLLVVSLGGQGQYEHVINNTGSPTSGTSTVPSNVVSFP